MFVPSCKIIIKLTITSILLLFPSCTTLKYQDNEKNIVLSGSIGSASVFETGHQFNHLIDMGKPIIWDGPMISADAFYAPAAVKKTGGCYTSNATWHPHAASYFSIIPEWIIPGDPLTEQLASLLPAKMQSKFKRSWHRWDHVTIPFYGIRDLQELWPEGECKDDHVKS